MAASCRLRPFKIVISSVFKVRFTLQSGPSRDRLVNDRFVLRFQPVDATHALLLSAGVSIPPENAEMTVR